MEKYSITVNLDTMVLTVFKDECKFLRSGKKDHKLLISDAIELSKMFNNATINFIIDEQNIDHNIENDVRHEMSTNGFIIAKHVLFKCNYNESHLNKTCDENSEVNDVN